MSRTSTPAANGKTKRSRRENGIALSGPVAGLGDDDSGCGALETQVRDLERLHEVTMRIARTADRQAAMNGVLEAVLGAVGASKGLLSLLRVDGGRLQVATAVGFSGEFLQACGASEAEGGACGAVLVRRERVVVEDARIDPLMQDVQEAVRLGGFAACHSVPLLTHGGEMIGVLTAHFAQPHRPDEREKRLIDLYARMAADFIARDRAVGCLREGNATGFLGTVADVSADRRAESEIRASEGRYRELMQNLPVAVYTTDGDGHVGLFNAAAVELWGREPRPGDRWCGSARMHTLDGAELPLDRCPMAVALKDGRAADGVEAIVERPDGEWRYVLENPHPFFDGEGNVVGGVNVLLDITERWRADDARAQLGAIVESSEDAIVSKNLDGIILSWNAGAERLFGYTADEAIGRSITMLIPPDRLAEEPRILSRIRAGERIQHFETVRRRKDGRLIDISLTVSPVRDGHGRVVGASKIARDVTEQKQAEAELRRREQVYRAIGESVDYGIWVWDADGRNIYASESFLKMTGLTQAQCAGLGWTSRLSPQEAEATIAAWKECMRTGCFWEREHRFLGADGKTHPVLARGAPVRDEDGRIVYWAGINLDIAAFKEAEEALRRGQQQLRLVTDNAIVFLAQIDREHRLKFVNRPYAARFGIEPEEAVGRHVQDVVGAAAYAAFKPQIEAAMAGQRVEFEREIPYEQFGRRWVRVIHEPERNARGEVVGLVAVISDITPRKQSEREMEQARDRALAASRAKDDFLAALSHELRTPLNPVLLLASEAAGDPTLPEPVRADFATIRKNVELEARLIDDLLDLTRITRGKLSLNLALQDVRAIVQDALATMRGDLEQKRLVLTCDLGEQEAKVRGDAVRLQQVLWNVLKNAVKFTPDGGTIAVRIDLSPETESAAIEIRDTGIGMTPAEIARAFDAFSQGDHATGRDPHRFGGVGLGLTISRMLMELHRGRIEARSEGRDHGSTFRIELPLAGRDERKVEALLAARDPSRPPFAMTNGAGRPAPRLLLVEDHEPTRVALEQLLKRRNYDVVVAGSVAEARAAAADATFDLVLSDVGLPDGNGYDLMAELRKKRSVVGIALTGYGMDHDIARSQVAGFAVHLTKPVTVQSLDRALAAAGAARTNSR